MSDPAQAFDVLVIGAGPAGLALGRELRRLGVSFRIIERGATVGESWRRMPESLKLVSPWKATHLPGETLRSWKPNREVRRAEFLEYLVDYARTNELPILTGTEVLAVRRDSAEGFTVETSVGPFVCRRVVSAAGYFQNPHVPKIEGLATTRIPWRHVASYRSVAQLEQELGGRSKRILIVGKRLSAGQILVELSAAGFVVSISHRSPIQFGSGPIGWWFFFRIYPWLETRKLRRHGEAARGFEVQMPGGQARRLIQNGTVRCYPAIQSLGAAQVNFQNGEVYEPDAILFATGFRPALEPLQPLGISIDPGTGRPKTLGMQSAEVAGLYFLGLDHGRNFQSRFIRGIRNDAVVLAQRLAEAKT